MLGESKTPAQPDIRPSRESELSQILEQRGLGICSYQSAIHEGNEQDPLKANGVFPLPDLLAVSEQFAYYPYEGSGEYSLFEVVETSFGFFCHAHARPEVQFQRPSGIDAHENIRSIAVEIDGTYQRVIDGVQIQGKPQQGKPREQVYQLLGI